VLEGRDGSKIHCGAAHLAVSEWMKTPIQRLPNRGDNWRMVQFTIRCHPVVPVATDELERWLELEVHELRAAAPQGTIRLSRLTQTLQSTDLGIGWLVELELPEGQPLLARDRLAEALRDMRLLGLQPTLLTPLSLSDWTSWRDDRATVVSSRAPSANGVGYGE
jgi:hypothetical protein